MGSDLNITRILQDYILKHGLKLHTVQKDIINYNLSLGDAKRMQISISQCQFLHLLIKISKIKNVLEIGTFTGLSTLSMALALPNDGKITALDKNNKTTKITTTAICVKLGIIMLTLYPFYLKNKSEFLLIFLTIKSATEHFINI